ncbi:uncharacterized protein K489DRAFT_354998, partial [Dissoconium aciculare CBS 342.82]|uniref:Nephrocystin 3-like N-terminal domain-containing protein n=1 Tax=Dissoconium aciculare CBS 342.82 TaxID=1314786 RepID=A0A6J3MD17_9PEZI
MSGVEFAASVAGLASLGIQVCQGLLAYYDGFKDYHADISSTYRNIASMNDVFASLKSLLEDTSLSSKNRAHVQSGILACEATLHKVHGKLKKLRTHDEPSGAKQKAWADLQRLFYPFRASTLAKLKELMEELRGNLSMAIHVLQLDVAVITSHKLDDLFIQGQGISKKLGSIEAQGNAADHKLDTIATSHRDYQKRMILRADAHAAENRRRWDALTHQVNSNSEQMGHIQFRDIILWLSRANMSSSHDAATSKHVHGTGQWLLDLSEYKLWKSSEETVLWLSGKAGCGKTILCSTVIDELTSTLCVGQGDEIRLAYYYFSFNNPEYHGLQSFLASIAAQVCHLAPVSTRARSMYASQQGSIGKASTRQAQELIDLALRHVRLFVVVDALDEIPEQDNKRQEILDWIEQAANARKKIKIFAVSRVSGDIQSAMIASRALHINIGGSGCDADIKKYIVEELRLDRRFEGLSDHLKERIEQELSSKADGMFRWAYCQLESLKRLKSKRPAYIEQTLKGLPLTLDETYERMLAQIDPMFRVEASKALRWLSFAVTPLTMAQLNEACLIDLDDDELVQVENRVPCQELLEILGSLILIEGYPVTRLYSHDDPDGRYWFHDGLRVRLSHFSVQEYLVCNRIKESKLSQFALQPDDGRTVLLRYTIAYLECCVQAMQDVMPESLDSPFRPTLGRQALFYGRYPLFRYMAFALATYLSTDDETIVQQAMPLLRAGGF